MTRLALAKTIVSGTITLQGNTFTFTASSSGTATGNTVTEAKASATAASNSAAITAARASIDKILAENSAVLSDLEITSLISNNLSTTVVVYKPILLKSIATTTDGVNYTLLKDTVIKSDQWLTVPNGKTLTIANYHFTNNGYFQVGEPLQDTTTAQADYSFDASNNGVCEIYSGSTCNIDAGYTFQNYAQNAYLLNNGTCNNSGTILNSSVFTSVQNNGTFNNLAGSTIENSGDYANITNFGTCNNYSTIENSGMYADIINMNGTFFNYDGSIIKLIGRAAVLYNFDTATFYNFSTIKNNGQSTVVSNNTGGIFFNGTSEAYASSSIENSGAYSALINSGNFNNYGAITNTGPSSATRNFGTWNGNGTCTGECQNT